MELLQAEYWLTTYSYYYDDDYYLPLPPPLLMLREAVPNNLSVYLPADLLACSNFFARISNIDSMPLPAVAAAARLKALASARRRGADSLRAPAMGKSSKPNSKATPAKRPGPIKGQVRRPARPFAMFLKSVFSDLDNTSTLDRTEVMREAATRWRNLPEEEKDEWRSKYQAAFAETRAASAVQIIDAPDGALDVAASASTPAGVADGAAKASSTDAHGGALAGAPVAASESKPKPPVKQEPISQPPGPEPGIAAHARQLSVACPSPAVACPSPAVACPSAAVACPGTGQVALPEASQSHKKDALEQLPSCRDPGVPHGISVREMRAAMQGAGAGDSGGSVMLGRFAVVNASLLGSGSFGTVVKVEDRHTCRLYAAKVFTHGGDDCARELKVYERLAQAPHEAFLPLLGAHTSKAISWFVLPWCPGSLAHHLRNGVPLDRPVAYGVTNQLRVGLQHLHSIGWLHLDLKPGNVLYDPRTRHASLCDFSISEQYPLRPEVVRSAATWCTDPFRPPELFRAHCGQHLSPAVDTWSLGCTAFEAACGKRLFSHRAAITAVCSSSAVLPPVWHDSQPWCRALTMLMLRPLPAQRWQLRYPFPPLACLQADGVA